MQEDVLGTLSTITRTNVAVTCARCGKATPRSQARIVASAVLDDAHSEFTYLCRECDAAIKAGEDVSAEA